MKKCTRGLVFVLVAFSACAKVDQAAVVGSTGGAGGGTTAGSGGTIGAGGSGVPGTGGEMRGTMGSTGGGGGEASCGMENFDLVRKPPEILLVLDRSKSMKDDLADKATTVVADWKWSKLIPALTQVISESPDILWGLKVFPESPDTGKACLQTSVTPKIDLQVAEMSSTTVANYIMTNVTAEGDGTPTGPAVIVATDYFRKLTTTNRKYILLATDGQPSCGGQLGSLVEDTATARTDAVAAVTAAASAGFHTFVVGVATTKDTDKMTLNQLATAGLEGRSDPNPLADRFYLASTQAELTTAFKVITGVASSCLFPLSKPPPVPENIAVKVAGVKAPADSSNTNGWNYTDANHTSVEVFGSWCEMIKTTAANKVEIIFGCPNVPIP